MTEHTTPLPDNITPPALFAAVRERFGRPAALLESLAQEETDHMSVIAAGSVERVALCEDDPDVFTTLRQALERCPRVETGLSFDGGLIGYVPYEFSGMIEPKVARTTGYPVGLFHRFERFLILNHRTQAVQYITPGNAEGELDLLLAQAAEHPLPPLDTQGVRTDEYLTPELFGRDTDFDGFAAKVQQAQQAIRNGEVFQVIASCGFERTVQVTDGLPYYRLLRELEPTTHLLYLDFGADGQVVGASPEILGRKRGETLLYRPIAGTRYRGTDNAHDARLAQEMQQSPKENAEHDMLLDLGRNDLGRIAEPGSVRVTDEKYVKRFANVMHMVSDIEAVCRADTDAVDFLRAIFPAGTLTGAPKIRAMQVIARLEEHRRGLYGGAAGYMSAGGNMDMAIGIRSFFLQEGRITFRTGGGIVQDSTPKHEWLELHNKAKSLMKVITCVNA